MLERKLNLMTEYSFNTGALNTIIRYKTIVNERFEDAPFIGALISAIDCKYQCKECFNQPLKDIPNKQDTVINIINQIKNNPFNQGIIFGGLEWDLQYKELIALASESKKYKLQTMLYSGVDRLEDLSVCPDSLHIFDYIKIGSYQKKLTTKYNVQYSVKLATSNQIIYKNGINY